MKSLAAPFAAAFGSLFLFGALVLAQSKAPDPPKTNLVNATPNEGGTNKFTEPAKIPIPATIKDELRAAIHKQDQAQKKISDLNANFMQVQQQATQQMNQLQAQNKEATDAIEAAKTKAYAAAKLDREKYDLDLEGMEFTPKAAPPAPETKK